MKHTLLFLLLIYASSLQITVAGSRPKLTDDESMVLVQEQTFRYLQDFAHPKSGLTRKRGNDHPGVVTIGGSSFGVMAIVVGMGRDFATREQGAERLLKMAESLNKTDSYRGVWVHWMDDATGKAVPFSRKNDGVDLVESAFIFEGLLVAHQYFDRDTPIENRVRGLVNSLWHQTEQDWFTRGGEDVLYWHWSSNSGWAINHQLKGQSECHIAYVLAAFSPTYPVRESVYHEGWANSITFKNGKEFYSIRLSLDTDFGGPLFFTHYSYLGLDPRGLKDHYASCGEQMKTHILISHAYYIDSPRKYKGYSRKCQGLTASDNHLGYSTHCPQSDLGMITPTAAISSTPYTPEHSLEATRYFYEELGDRLWGEYGFKDAFSLAENWFAPSHLTIDQGPIMVMIENYRTGLIQKLFISHPDVQRGLKRLGFSLESR